MLVRTLGGGRGVGSDGEAEGSSRGEERRRETQMPEMSAEENPSSYFTFCRHVFNIFS